MKHIRTITTALLVLVLFPFGAAAQEGPRPASEIISEFNRVPMPSFSQGNSPEAVAAFRKAIDDGCRKKGALAWELYASYPDHDRVPDMLWIRWAGMMNALDEAAEVLDETAKLLDEEKRESIRLEAIVAAALAAAKVPEVKRETKLSLVQEAARLKRGDDRVGHCLLEIAKYQTSDVAEMRKLADQIVKDFGDAEWTGPAAKGFTKQLGRLGKELALDFTDVVTGKKTSLAASKKPTLVMIWSGGEYSKTIPGELAAVNAWAKKNPGVRVVGIHSWKHGKGREGLKADLEKRGIAWPHAYPEDTMDKPWGGPWSGEVPMYWVLDAGGKRVGFGYRFASVVPQLAKVVGK